MTRTRKHWPTRPLGDCAKFLSGGTPSKARADFWDGDIPWVSSGEMTESRIRDASLHITPEAAEEGSRLVPENTVLAVVRGMSLAKEFRVSITERVVAFNQDLKAFSCRPDVDPEFFFYALFARREHIRQLATEASHGTKKLETDTLARVGIPMPELPIQRRTVEVACAYDVAIENNRRRMVLLEKTARLLYEEWFVRLRFPGHEHTPVANGLPKGWRRTELGDVAESFEDGDWIESKDQGGEDYRLLQISNIGLNEFVETGNFRFISDETFRRLNCRELAPGDLLISRMPAPIGRAWLVTSMPWKMITAVDAAILKANEELADVHFVLHHLNSSRSIGYCEQHAGGATRPRITRRELARQPLVLPDRRVQSQFRDLIKPMNDLRTKLYHTNDSLRAARDLLLPRLMSGEIEV